MGARNRQRPSWIRGRDAIKILNGLYPRSPRTPQSSSMIRGAAKASWKLVTILKVSNGPAEGINSRIKAIKVRSHGFRNKERFANAIYFHLGGLNLYPKGISR